MIAVRRTVVAVAEMCIGGRTGAAIDIDTGEADLWGRLWGESWVELSLA